MITVVVLAVVLALAAPSFISIINNNRLAAQGNELVASLHHARSEAIRRNASITVCNSADGATCSAAASDWSSWLTVVGSSDEVLRSHSVKAPLQISSSAQGITFSGDGLARSATGGLLDAEITVCLPTERPPENRRIVRLASGSRVSTDSVDGEGVCP
ncbi:Tfp pilus assembly protein FimT/FimU [Luteimonas sp. R10]|uniref:GspH/FimT family pseudopilin n=1 Tax=Luteimonas sp. R10 TaxID=3108176 RepID=UPI00309394D6|nr:GspH/FimT family pseudopilin [Luteimonas sp. R10]